VTDYPEDGTYRLGQPPKIQSVMASYLNKNVAVPHTLEEESDSDNERPLSCLAVKKPPVLHSLPSAQLDQHTLSSDTALKAQTATVTVTTKQVNPLTVNCSANTMEPDSQSTLLGPHTVTGPVVPTQTSTVTSKEELSDLGAPHTGQRITSQV